MLHSENDVVITRSPADVYAFLVDGINNAAWRPGVKSIELAQGPAGAEGAVYKQVLSGPGGRDIAGDYRITKAVPGERIEFEVIAGPLRPTGAYVLAADGTGTRLTFRLDAQPTGMMRLMGGTIRRTMASEVGALENLKRILEG